MELRIKNLVEFAETAREAFRSIDVGLSKIAVRLDEISNAMATKAELAELKAELISNDLRPSSRGRQAATVLN